MKTIRRWNEGMHTRDEHCDVDPYTEECRTCGVWHGGPACPDCGGVAFHLDDCPVMRPEVGLAFAGAEQLSLAIPCGDCGAESAWDGAIDGCGTCEAAVRRPAPVLDFDPEGGRYALHQAVADRAELFAEAGGEVWP